MKVGLLGGPKHGTIVDMGPGWPGTRIPPLTYRVIEFLPPVGFEKPVGPEDFDDIHTGQVDYRYCGQVDDVLLYESPKVEGFTPEQRSIRLGLLRDAQARAYATSDYDGIHRIGGSICDEQYKLDLALKADREKEWGWRIPPHP